METDWFMFAGNDTDVFKSEKSGRRISCPQPKRSTTSSCGVATILILGKVNE